MKTSNPLSNNHSVYTVVLLSIFYLNICSTQSVAGVLSFSWLQKLSSPTESTKTDSDARPGYTDPFKMIKTVTLTSKEKGHFGIQSTTLTDRTTIITGVAPGSPAQKAKIRIGDHILKIDDFPVAQNPLVLLKMFTEPVIKITVSRTINP